MPNLNSLKRLSDLHCFYKWFAKQVRGARKDAVEEGELPAEISLAEAGSIFEGHFRGMFPLGKRSRPVGSWTTTVRVWRKRRVPFNVGGEMEGDVDGE